MPSAIPDSADQPAQIASQPVKQRRIPAKIRQAIELLYSGECKTQKAAAERVKITPEHLCKSLRLPHVLTYIEQQTRIALARAQLPAAGTLVRLLDAKSESTQKDVAIHILAVAGHKPQNSPQVSVNIELKAGYVIDLSEQARPAPITIEHSELTHD